ncbi:hypothetical protein [Sandaracinus amylolyticus]|uniref:hypothetical protein n=1 Tax=Sandaracinus amylolyticus TaxID=927083 RepID=UPI001F3B9988|nr:hypothetical protein [Sandaracinus amylolyticus]UJR86015.1 Hypothetical protein I5071_80960 [Sandaracinus amylolyticus]
MSTRDVTTPTERIDLLLEQARHFLELDLVGEAIARTRHALAQCEKELAHASDAATRHEIITRREIAIDLLNRLGGKPLPSDEEHGTI